MVVESVDPWGGVTSATCRRQIRSFPAMILICYDGSEDARAAIDRAAQLLRGHPATVLTVWEQFIDLMTRSGGLGMTAAPPDVGDLDDRTEQAAVERAEHGAETARAAGLDAQARSRARVTSIAEAILSEADATDAELIVVGSRGLTGVKSALLGSVSHALLQHADRPVLVVPSPKIAAERSAPATLAPERVSVADSGAATLAITISGQRAWRTMCADVLPRIRLRTGPKPREPVTRRSTSPLNAANSSLAIPVTAWPSTPSRASRRSCAARCRSRMTSTTR